MSHPEAARIRALFAKSPLQGGYRLARAATAGPGIRITFHRAQAPRLTLLVTPRDDAAPRAAHTRRWNVVCTSLRQGTLARPAERAFHDFVARLRAGEARGSAAPPGRGAPRIDAATRRLAGSLARMAEIEDEPRWRLLARWILGRAAERHGRAVSLGALGFDLALSARGDPPSWRAGITLNARAVPDLARRAAKLVDSALVDPAHADAARAALALASRPGVELTIGVVAGGAGAKLKIYAQEARHGAAPIDRAMLAPLALLARVDPRRLPARVAVACLDLAPSAPLALKVYTHDVPRAGASFAADARRAGGTLYFTRRFARGRARSAANAVFRAHRPALRRRALAFARRAAPRVVESVLSLAGDLPIAVTAVGIDLGGDEADVYFTLTPV